MIDTKIVLGFVALTTMAYIYNRVKDENQNIYKTHDDKVINQYLINKNTIINDKKGNKKPFLWIYNSYDANSRQWKTFGDRKSNDLNQPYIELCLQSIIKKNNYFFNICLISDSSIKKLLPELNIDIEKIPSPIKNHYVNLALMKILHRYGGLLLPSSFICFKNLGPIYNNNVRQNGVFCFEFENNSLTNDYERLLPSSKIMGCKRYDMNMGDIIHKYEELLSEDNTLESEVLGKLSHFLMISQEEGKIKVISGKKIGTRDTNNKPIHLENLFSSEFLQLCNCAVGLYIPQNKIKERNSFSWFCRLSPKQIFESRVFLCRLLLLSQGEIYQKQKEKCMFKEENKLRDMSDN